MKINIKFDNVEMLIVIIMGHMLFLLAHCPLEVGQTKCGCDDTDFFCFWLSAMPIAKA